MLLALLNTFLRSVLMTCLTTALGVLTITGTSSITGFFVTVIGGDFPSAFVQKFYSPLI